MKCRKLIFVVTAMLLAAFQVTGQQPEQMAAQAAKAYNSKQYSEAISLYEKIIAQGNESSALYYNLGNAYFRNNEYAHSVLFYEKALKLAPNNDDIRNNIEVVNSKLTDKVETVPELFYKRWWKQIVNLMSFNSLAILTVILLTISLILISIYIASAHLLLRKICFWSGIAILLLFGLGIIAASQRNHYLKSHHSAIVFAPTVNIKSSPDDNSKDIFVLHEGTKVTLLDRVADWQEIRISNGSIGWIRSSDIREI